MNHFSNGVGWHGPVDKSSIYTLGMMDFVQPEDERQEKKACIFRNTPARDFYKESPDVCQATEAEPILFVWIAFFSAELHD